MNSIFRRAAILAALFAGVFVVPVQAHETRDVGGHSIVVGWAEEPAFVGFVNAVSFRASEGGRGIEGLQMRVEVLFGDKDATKKTEPLNLSGAFGDPGHYTASIIPTSPGQYTFHITGSIDNEPFDQFFTSGEETFDGVRETTELQFPERHPSTGELASRLNETSVGIGQEADQAEEQAKTARLFAIGAAALAVIALLVALISRRSRT